MENFFLPLIFKTDEQFPFLRSEIMGGGKLSVTSSLDISPPDCHRVSSPEFLNASLVHFLFERYIKHIDSSLVTEPESLPGVLVSCAISDCNFMYGLAFFASCLSQAL